MEEGGWRKEVGGRRLEEDTDTARAGQTGQGAGSKNFSLGYQSQFFNRPGVAGGCSVSESSEIFNTPPYLNGWSKEVFPLNRILYNLAGSKFKRI